MGPYYPTAVRILVISNMYPPHHYGGYELSCRDVVDRWRAAGHEVTVLTTTMRVPGVSTPDPGFVRRELSMYWDDHVLTSPPVWRRFAAERHNLRVLQRALDEVRPDVVSVWNMGAMSLGLLTMLRRRSVPVVYVVCDDWMLYGGRLDAWARLFGRRRRLGRLITFISGVPTEIGDLGAEGTFLFVSETTRQRAARRWQIPTSAVVHTGIDHHDFPLTPPRSDPWRWRLLYVGRIDERKGIATAVSALGLLPASATLTISGAGEESHRLDLVALASRLGVADRIRWINVDRAALRDEYMQADVFVFPSVWEEPFGLVPVEAMACATPVVATGVGGSGEFLQDGVNCLLFPASDAAALAAAVTRLASSASLRESLVAGGLRTAADLDIDHYASVLAEWHATAAGDP